MGGVAIDDRRKARTPFLSFICMFVRHFSSGGARSSVGWTSRCVGEFSFGVSYSFLTLPSSPTPPLPRASSCSCSHCRHKIGRTTKSRCSSAKRSCSIRSGTMRRATLRESESSCCLSVSVNPAYFCAHLVAKSRADPQHTNGGISYNPRKAKHRAR